MKRIISLLLTLVLCFSLLHITIVSAADRGELNNGCTWSFDKGILTISGTGSVKFNKNAWKAYNSLIEKFVVSEGITEIKGNSGIADMTDICELVLPDSLKIIGQDAFSKYPLESVDIPYGVTQIYDGAFEYSNLKSVVVPDSVTEFVSATLSGGAFAGSKLESIKLSNNLKTINDDTFKSCNNLKNITIPASVETMGGCFYGCENLQEVIFKTNRLEYLDYRMFDGCKSLKSIELPEGITEIRLGAFKNCSSLERINIPKTVVNVGANAFESCYALKEIKFHENIEFIGVEALRFIPNLEMTILNPTCEIKSKQQLGENPTIYGYDYSTAHAFAKENGYTFVSLGEYIDDETEDDEEEYTEECSHSTYDDEYAGESTFSPIDGNDTHHSATHTYDRICRNCYTLIKTFENRGENERHNFSGNTCTDCGYSKSVKQERLATPKLYSPVFGGDTYYANCGDEIQNVCWTSVSGAECYTIIMYSDLEGDGNFSEKYIIDEENTTSTTLPPVYEEGLYAYSIYAGMYDDDSVQSLPYTFNVYYSEKEGDSKISAEVLFNEGNGFKNIADYESVEYKDSYALKVKISSSKKLSHLGFNTGIFSSKDPLVPVGDLIKVDFNGNEYIYEITHYLLCNLKVGENRLTYTLYSNDEQVEKNIIAYINIVDGKSTTTKFTDISSDATYANAVYELSSKEVINGYTDGTFKPENTLTRAEAAKMLCTLLGYNVQSQASTKFTDVPYNHWAGIYINAAVNAGIISGYSDTQFGPEDKLQVVHLATLLVRAFGYENEAMSAGGYPIGYITTAKNKGFLDKIEDLKSEDYIKRSESAVMMYNASK